MTTDIADAASLILFGSPARSGDPPPLLMIERGAALAFAGGALVFPGGRVDPGDHVLALELGDAEVAPRIAAIREAIEETGIAVGLDPVPDASTVAALRAGIHAGEPFGRLLAAAGLGIAPEGLTLFARWLPPAVAPRRFDTRFYLAEAPASPLATPDGEETVSTFWITAEDALQQAAEGRHRLLFPTRRMLERLAALGDAASARADAAGRSEVVVTPFIEERDGERWLCLPDGLGYPITAELLATVIRG